MLILWTSAVHWLEQHQMPCPFKAWFYLPCPGCGFQRSLVAFMKGEWLLSFEMYPGLIPLLGLLLFVLLHVRKQFTTGASWIQSGYLFVTALILLSYVTRILHHFQNT